MAKNQNLNAASRAKKDKFYTQLSDIEREVWHYRDFFKDKVVLCNCDDPFESWFFKYFAAQFNFFGLKKLISTSYADSPIAGQEILLDFDNLNRGKKAFIFEGDSLQDWNGDGQADIDDVEFAIRNGIYKCTPLEGDDKYCAGDFRSKECIELLQQADVVVTNPPFSVFREYVAQLMRYNKKFLIIGNQNAITYKEIFPLIMKNKIWLGYGFVQGNAYFSLPNGDYKDFAKGVYDSETGLIKFRNLHWFTNLEVKKRHEDIPLFKRYYENPEKYPHYDNYDAIEVSKTAEIPEDYYGVMGVPITFLDKYNPAQFEILGATESEGKGFSNGLWKPDSKCAQATINGQKVYKRIFIRRRQ